MGFRDLKYLSAFIIPVLVYWGIQTGGLASYAAMLFAFVFVPLIEPILQQSEQNLDLLEKESKDKSLFFDLLLYLNIPILYFLIFLFAVKAGQYAYTSFEIVGNILSLGLLLGSAGINVAHELGHKPQWYARLSAVVLLTPSLYTHFYIEHNRGHHRNVATPEDPATAHKGESLYRFWIRSFLGGYLHAWQLESKRLAQSGRAVLSVNNLMLVFTGIQGVYILCIILMFGWTPAFYLLAAGTISFLFLETINYVEHYGLMRRQLESGRYERVQPWHSWNSNHYLGRIILYELTRHSDHHFIANKKYQLLDHHDRAPQLPFGYPTSMLMSMMPPLWFGVMDRRVDAVTVKNAG